MSEPIGFCPSLRFCCQTLKDHKAFNIAFKAFLDLLFVEAVLLQIVLMTQNRLLCLLDLIDQARVNHRGVRV